MFSLPSLPSWDGLHPIVVHFPIALVMVAPVFVVLAMLMRPHARVLLACAAVMMLMAGGGALLASNTGEAAEGNAERVPGAEAALERHEELGEAAQNFTLALAGVLTLGAGVYWVRGAKAKRGVMIGACVVYLLAHGAGALVTANAAHEGGRLVHEFGVRAWAGPGGAPPAADPRPAAAADDD